jgi:D-beta-D-heptose 7-phosphate kinase / D-beta-D-heptose 1-phosphate adenosyltransferase
VSAPLVVIGDALLDRDVEGAVERLSPDAPVPVVDESASVARPGGAGLAAALAAADGREVTLITALAEDNAGRELAVLLRAAGVELIDLGLDGPTPEKVRFLCDGRPLLRLDRGGREPVPVRRWPAGARAAVEWAAGVLVSDYGRGVTSVHALRQTLRDATARVPVVWDPHPRGTTPVPGACMAVPNAAELDRLVPEPRAHTVTALVARAAELRGRWLVEHVCVTRGADGALMVGPAGSPLAVPVEPVRGGDPCGAGDRFASAVAGALADGASAEEAAAAAAVAATALVAAGGAGRALTARRMWEPEPSTETPFDICRRVRAAGGTVVATGGCFDLLHPGHIATLQAARLLGDCLVVLINSDESVRRLKGLGRPLVRQEDRAAVVAALRCVDSVLVFDEDTPGTVLERLRPDVWAKGGDYAAAELPEAAVVERAGGRSVVLPYVNGRSTTRLIEEAAQSA